MENSWSWGQKTLVNELIQGMEVAKQLRLQLNATSSIETRDLLVQRIVSSYEKALMILNWGGSIGAQPQGAGVVAAAVVPGSPRSLNGSPRSDDLDGVVKENQAPYDASKKRKTMPRWTDQVRVNPENGLEGPHDDGYSWRKYGQKDILGAKYPRSYYRCTYRNTQNCWATKQVQRSDEDPTVFEITYRGVHTCSHGNTSIPQPESPEKQEQKQNFANTNYLSQQQHQEALLNLQKGLKINTENLDGKENEFHFSFPSAYQCMMSGGSSSPSFISPATPEPKCYSASPFQMNQFGGLQSLHHSESDFTEIISATTSGTNSPIVDPISNLDFTLDPSDFGLAYPFDRFFS